MSDSSAVFSFQIEAALGNGVIYRHVKFVLLNKQSDSELEEGRVKNNVYCCNRMPFYQFHLTFQITDMPDGFFLLSLKKLRISLFCCHSSMFEVFL